MPGTIIFKPIEANIISKDKDALGRMDPYLSFHLGGLKRVKGEVAKSGGQHPIWNDAITVEVSNQTSLTVDLKDKDMLIDDKIASFEVDLREVESQGRVRKWYPIFNKSEPAGELLMEATFSGAGGQFGSGLNQGQYAGVGGYSQGQYGTTSGLNQGQYGSGLSQGQGYSASGFTSGNVMTTPGTVIGHTSTSYPVQTTQSNLPQSQYPSGGLQQGSQYSAVPLGGLQQGQLGGLQSGQYGGLPQGQGYGSQISSEQFAKEALMRGSDPLNTKQNLNYNLSQGGYGASGAYGGYGDYGTGAQQNLTQTPNFSGTDPLLYEGDKNRFSNPPQQVPYGKKNVEAYAHNAGKHGTQGTQGTQGYMNPGSNPNPGYY